MNTLPEDVIIDLLPLYFADEASPASRALVEDYLAAHPDFAATMRASQQAQVGVPADAPENDSHRTLKRIRSSLKWRAALIAVGIFITLVPFTFVYNNNRFEYLMLRDAPVAATAFWCVAALVWGGLWHLVRRMNTPQP